MKGAVAANSERKRTARADLKSMWEIAVSVPFKQTKQKRKGRKRIITEGTVFPWPISNNSWPEMMAVQLDNVKMRNEKSC